MTSFFNHILRMTNNHSSGSFVLFFIIMNLEKTREKKLSEHFSLYEMIYSETAVSHHIDNMPNETETENLKYLCEKILEPLRQHFGVVRINSGFRCPKLNQRIGGVGNSQHQFGQAADIRCSNKDIARKYFSFITVHCIYDQLLFEYNRCGIFWIHVSLRRDEKNRRMRIENYPTK